MNPKRIQLKRTKGWKMPANTVVVSRPSRFGNPFKLTDVGINGDRAECVRVYEAFLMKAGTEQLKSFLEPLRGKNLACWCPIGAACHADVLLRIANE